MVTELGKKYQFEVELIKKSEAGNLGRAALPKFPAMEIDDELIFEDNIITAEKLEELAQTGAFDGIAEHVAQLEKEYDKLKQFV